MDSGGMEGAKKPGTAMTKGQNRDGCRPAMQPSAQRTHRLHDMDMKKMKTKIHGKIKKVSIRKNRWCHACHDKVFRRCKNRLS